jgi:hypothetical protein
MGTYFLPIAGGSFLGGLISGEVYGKISDKITLLQQEIALRGFNLPEISESFTQNNYVQKACELMGMDESTLTEYLWVNYNPSRIWIVLTGIGVATVLLLYIYNKVFFRNTHSDN